MQIAELKDALRLNMPHWLTRLQDLVLCESPTEDAAAVNRAMDLVQGWAAEVGARTVRHPQQDYGDVLELWFDGADAEAKPLMLLGHLDTVWPTGTLATMPWRQAADSQGQTRLWGPGVLDMKAGVVMALAAVQTVQQAGGLRRSVVLLLNPDEETGSAGSRAHTERIARECEAVFVLEPRRGCPARGMTPPTRQRAKASARTGCRSLVWRLTRGLTSSGATPLCWNLPACCSRLPASPTCRRACPLITVSSAAAPGQM